MSAPKIERIDLRPAPGEWGEALYGYGTGRQIRCVGKVWFETGKFSGLWEFKDGVRFCEVKGAPVVGGHRGVLLNPTADTDCQV